MAARVDYYFSLISPYAYLGHAAFLDAAREAGAEVAYRPVRIFDLFAANGGVPLGQRAPARQRYRLVELQRWRARRGLPLNLSPKFFPTDPGLADRCALAIAAAGGDPSAYMDAAFRALWVHDHDLGDLMRVADLLERHGFDAAQVVAAADADDTVEAYRRNTEAAIAADLPGLPGYVLDGEPFWGQDRVEELREALLSGRPPYRHDGGRD